MSAFGIVCLIVIIVIVIAASAVLEAYLEIEGRPTEEMFHCTKHGPFRKKHALPLFPELAGRAVNSNVCPICYKETVYDNIKVD